MNTLDNIAQRCGFEEFKYQVVYLKPTHYLDERFAVGVIAEAPSRLEVRFVSSVRAVEAMSSLLGEEGVEQFQFAVAECRRTISKACDLQSFDLSTDIFVLGEPAAAFTSDRSGLVTSILSSSCLLRAGAEKRANPVGEAASPEFSRDLIGHVSRLNPLVADRIFNRKVTVEADEVELPIFGSRVFGAPISFAEKDQSLRTESYIARFHWLRHHLTQEPRVYVLHPHEGTRHEKAGLRLRKLHAIAEASNVPLVVSASTEEIATRILRDEAA